MAKIQIGVVWCQTYNIKLWSDKYNAPYVLTKPMHHSQKVEKQHEDGSIEISIKVKLDFELERLILGFGEAIEVVQPERLRERIRQKLRRQENCMSSEYTDNCSDS